MTSQEPKPSQSVERDIPDTEVIALSASAPVFVDATGRRRRLFQRLAYAFGGLCMLYGGLISVSLAGGPIRSSAILPLPNLGGVAKPAAERPSPRPTPRPSAIAPPILESQPRRVPVRHAVVSKPARPPAPKPTATSKRPPTPSPTATATAPIEATGTPAPASPPTDPPSQPTGDPVPPVPPPATGASRVPVPRSTGTPRTAK